MPFSSSIGCFPTMQPPRKVPLYEFCPSTRVWQAISPVQNGTYTTDTDSNSPLVNKRFTCVTYNVFSGALSKSVPHATHRTKNAIAVLSRSKSDVIALQEVSLAFEQTLRRERWLREDWLLTSLQDYFETADPSSTGSQAEKDGCIIAIRRDLADEGKLVSMLPLSGQQGKVLIMVIAKGGIGFVTSHFESLAESERIRLHQYNQVLHITRDITTCVVLADFNHSSYSELKNLVGPTTAGPTVAAAFRDCILASTGLVTSSHARDPLRDNATFGELYPYFEGSRRREKRKPRRLDLLLVKGNSLRLIKHWTDGHRPIQVDRREKPRKAEEAKHTEQQKTQKVKLRCQQGRGGNTFASDHLAVIATFELV